MFDAKRSNYNKEYKDVIVQIESFQVFNTQKGMTHVYVFSDGVHTYPGLVLKGELQQQYATKIGAQDLLSIDLKVYEIHTDTIDTIGFLCTSVNMVHSCSRTIGKSLVALNAQHFFEEFKKVKKDVEIPCSSGASGDTNTKHGGSVSSVALTVSIDQNDDTAQMANHVGVLKSFNQIRCLFVRSFVCLLHSFYFSSIL